MIKLSSLKSNDQIKGVQGNEPVRIISIEKQGEDAYTIYYKNSKGQLGEQLLHTSDQERLEYAGQERPWSFNANGEQFSLALEAYRIRLAHLFDPMIAVHTSNVTPLPHQISAVYESMLPKQPLRFVLADDPGAGKTIMAGLLIRELVLRADAKRILIIAPGSLVEQWQDELFEKFGVHFDIFTREKQEHSVTGNYFDEKNQVIAKIDQLARAEDLKEKLLNANDWDLVVVDEAHKMSANYYGTNLNKTQRFRLGEDIGRRTRHFLLMTATPHNGKEDDFQMFLSLLDSDRFYGKVRDGTRKVDVSDLMLRRVKEDLLKFDGTRLFPERRAYTANYTLSDEEAALYHDVSEYVRNEMNRAERNLEDGKRRGTVGFALTQLQRRLASSPAAIYESIKRRRAKLEQRLADIKIMQRGQFASEILRPLDNLDAPSDIYDAEDEFSAEQYEDFSEEVMDQATAASTIEELEAEIIILKDLEQKAKIVVHSGSDRKWDELSHLLNSDKMKHESGRRRKLIIFTEHKDTLYYLEGKITNWLGNQPDAVVTIHGGVKRDLRRNIQTKFRNHPDVLVLIATDAAGEGVNLQNANLMINYDLPWNPNRLEQRFGRIHRIGQTEVCHLWNIVASETREGQVFSRLLEKLDVEREALGGRVFDILGEAFDNKSLKDLLIEAIRYGEQPSVKARLYEVIDGALDSDHLKGLMKRNALVENQMNIEDLYAVKEEMDKAEARKLQPHFIQLFFSNAFSELDGKLKPRESGRFEISYVPASIKERDRVIGETRTPVAGKYERICFEKERCELVGKPLANLIHPGHPLMASSTDIILEKYRPLLKQGAILVDPNDDSTEPKVMVLIDHSIRENQDSSKCVSQRLQFIHIKENKTVANAGWAPHLDYEIISESDFTKISDLTKAPWINSNIETTALAYASQKLAPEHYSEIRGRREKQAEKILTAVNERLIKEINYWTDRYEKLRQDASAGKQPRMQPENAKRRVDELAARLEQRKREIESMRNVVSSTPLVVGGALVIPQGLLEAKKGNTQFSVDAEARKRVEMVAMNAVMDVERELGHEIFDVSSDKCGWDITARPPITNGKIIPDRHIEVKGRSKGQDTITITRNEIVYGLNQSDKFILAIVIVDGNNYEGPYYIRNPFGKEPDLGVASLNYQLNSFLDRSMKAKETIGS
ncbi:DUF3883 domain-containing protein [archaeon]|jgi:superfamily II DNA or RNA helicase|nr:DUF3883 domain-containing protein [archaeon]MBT7931736.1 DUF3883 domain-containing protein [Candidatus Woesearchaeota archaeon]